MATFTYTPDSATKAQQPVTRDAQFGDGYMQRVADGINTNPKEWALTFTGRIAEITPIDTFLAARGGFESFDWTDPDGAAGKFICKSWTKPRPNGDTVQTLSATFNQVFGE